MWKLGLGQLQTHWFYSPTHFLVRLTKRLSVGICDLVYDVHQRPSVFQFRVFFFISSLPFSCAILPNRLLWRKDSMSFCLIDEVHRSDPTFVMPLSRHFWKRQAWQRFLLTLSTGHCFSLWQVYSIFFCTVRRKNPWTEDSDEVSLSLDMVLREAVFLRK